MPQRVRIVLFVVVLVAFGGFLSAFLGAGSGSRAALTRGEFRGYVRPAAARVPSFSLRNQDGRRVTGARGVAIYAFVSSSCRDRCPLAIQQVRGALDDLGRDVPVLGISVDPARDTPARAKAFMARQSMTGRMDFLLGSRADLRPVWKAFGVAPKMDGPGHSAGVVVVDGEGRQRVGFPDGALTPEALAADLRRLGA